MNNKNNKESGKSYFYDLFLSRNKVIHKGWDCKDDVKLFKFRECLEFNFLIVYLMIRLWIVTITIILNPLVISYKKYIYTGSYLCVFIRVRLMSSIRQRLVAEKMFSTFFRPVLTKFVPKCVKYIAEIFKMGQMG